MTLTTTPELNEILLEMRTKIMNSINEDESYSAISEMDLLLKMLPEDFKEQNNLQELEENLSYFLKDPNNNRILRLNQRIKNEIETAIELYDIDVGSDTRLHYNQELEEDLIKIQDEIRKALAIILRTLLSGDVDIG